ncbi:MAG: phospho-sugar mutase [Lachnospiraceae bacterium]|jgi:phosphoglucomutase|nr:phospho-sugar mutase [Lachnospiraceae bacterium]MCI1424567.1 phospho-sugar mutase [Lachnospiraceae bacterium]MCI1453326.1 phospho-sugar mutase [Lachnospiraceae bacterium]MDD5847872.1 phospho-sugar mutase [Bacillota bacterium]
MNAQTTYETWLAKLPKDDPLYAELVAIRGNEAEITDRFYQEIVFGTAGLRGICGAGTNRMNAYTVGRATQGIADYIKDSGEDPSRGVAIAYDCRHHSREFSELAAEILSANGIRVYLFPSLRPTPELSFAIRKLSCVSGINMTASHNPKEYNGYKVYWEDGAQISGAVSNGILEKITAHDLFDTFPRCPLEEAKKKGLVTMLGEDMDRQYLDYVESMQQQEDAVLDKTVPIVYTPLNGAGSIPMARVMEERGFVNFFIVPEQKDPDPDFTTVPFPNPENPKAFALAEKLGREKDAMILIATDPDSDRMAVEVSDGKGGYTALNGNQTGALLIWYLAMSKKAHGTLPKKSAMITSIVTGDFGEAICKDYGIAVFRTLTGFKNICGKIPEIQKLGYTYFFGYEESIGCAPGEQVRDKDGITAGMLLAEMAAWLKKQGKTMSDLLDDLYQKYGYYAEDQVSVVLVGKEGQERIARILDAFRKGKPDHFGNFAVQETTDYLHGAGDIPPQNALKFVMTDGSWFAMRPSGTEPKIKFYYYTVTGDRALSAQKVADLKAAVGALVESIA